MTITMTANRLLQEGCAILAASGIDNAHQECIWLLADELEIPPVMLSAQPQRPVPLSSADHFRQKVERRRQGEPLQYVMGSAEFHGLTLTVGPGVLAPRPETEQLVELAGSLYPGAGSICDLCTGSGAIALALGMAYPQSLV